MGLSSGIPVEHSAATSWRVEVSKARNFLSQWLSALFQASWPVLQFELVNASFLSRLELDDLIYGYLKLTTSGMLKFAW